MKLKLKLNTSQKSVCVLAAIAFLVVLLIGQNCHAIEVHIGLASNFSEVSQSSSNPYGDYFRNGIQLAVENYQDRLNKKSIRIKLDEFDYGTSAMHVIEMAKKANASSVVAMVGYNWSTYALLAAPLHQQAKLAMLTPSATADRISQIGSFVHMGSFDNSYMAKTLARVAVQRLKARRVGMVVAEDCAYCHDLADAFAAEMKQLGSSVSIRVAISESQQDFKNIVHELKAMNLDAILLPNYELSSARVISTLSEAGLHPAFLGGDGWGNVGEEFFKIINGRKFTAYSVSHWHSDLKTAASIRFKKRYIEKFSKEPNDTAVLAYDAMSLLLNAILSTDRYARADVESALSRLQSFSGVTGVFKYRSQGGAPEKSIVLLRAENSKFKLIEQINPVGSDR